MIRFVVAAMFVACNTSPAESVLHPFQSPTWTTSPTDDELVLAIVGTGADEDRDAIAIARDLLIPAVRRYAGSDLEKVQRWLKRRHDDFEDVGGRPPGRTFLTFALKEGARDINARGIPLARSRLRAVLWPSEPMPEDWEGTPVLDQATLLARAIILDTRLKAIADRYHDRVPAAFGVDPPPLFTEEETVWRALAIARNTVYVALTGDYSVTNSSLRDELQRRGISTVPVRNEKPY